MQNAPFEHDRSRPPEGTAQGPQFRLTEDLRLLAQGLRNLVDAFAHGSEATSGLAGLVISAADVRKTLVELAGDISPDLAPLRIGDTGPVAELGGLFGLSLTERLAVLLAAASETDRRYERIFGFLSDDITNRLPTVEIVAMLAGAVAPGEVAAAFAPAAPLCKYGIITFPDDVNPVRGLPGRGFRLDPRIMAHLANAVAPERWLPTWATLAAPGSGSGATQGQATSAAQWAATWRAAPPVSPVTLILRGSEPRARLAYACALADNLGRRALIVDQRLWRGRPPPHPEIVQVLREPKLSGALLCIVPDPTYESAAQLGDDISVDIDLVVVSGRTPAAEIASPRLTVSVDVPEPTAFETRAAWAEVLSAEGIAGADIVAEQVAVLLPGRPAGVVQVVAGARLLGGPWPPPSPAAITDRIMAAARASLPDRLAGLAHRVRSDAGLDDVVLPPEPAAQLQSLCNLAKHAATLRALWQVAPQSDMWRGVTALFAGPPGAGKTMAAAAIAETLGRPLYAIDLSRVMDKYIGETEKQLGRVFEEAESLQAALFFDEADALFGKRTEVREANDRFANVQVSYLLQRIEGFSGLALLATNLRENIDAAFLRRLQAVIEFPVPGEAERLRIWKSLLPPGAPLAEDVDLAVLARSIRLTGGHLKQIVVAAAALAMAGDGRVRMADLTVATTREHRKLGHSWIHAPADDAALPVSRTANGGRPEVDKA